MCKILSIDKASIGNFQGYMRNFDFRVMRVGYLYGKFNDDTSVKAEVIYEPPQVCILYTVYYILYTIYYLMYYLLYTMLCNVYCTVCT
jgi:hypothetical protein